jgi:hypothetical protein
VQSFGTSFNDGLAFCAILAGAQLLDWSMVQQPATNTQLRQQVRHRPPSALFALDRPSLQTFACCFVCL